jgi:hypothetical protein
MGSQMRRIGERVVGLGLVKARKSLRERRKKKKRKICLLQLSNDFSVKLLLSFTLKKSKY